MPTQELVSLAAQGFKIKPVTSKRDANKGWAFKIQAPPMVFYVKKTKSGRLIAFNSKEAKAETTIRGLSLFKQEGSDLLGEKYVAKSILDGTSQRDIAV